MINGIEWEWSGLGSKELQPVTPNEKIFISPEDKTLLMYNLDEDQSGQYKCKMGQTLTVPYFLTVVQSNESNFIQVHTKESGKQPQPTPPEEIEDYNLIIDTEWGQWSSCSTCDEVGKKHKIGYCVILLSEKHSHVSDLRSFYKIVNNNKHFRRQNTFRMACNY